MIRSGGKLVLLCMVLCLGVEAFHRAHLRTSRGLRRVGASMTAEPSMYTAVLLKAPKAARKNIILVKDTEVEIIDTISSWTTKESIDEAQIKDWSEQGLAFWNSGPGTRSMHIAEARHAKTRQSYNKNKPDASKYAANMYVKVGSEEDPVYVKASKTSSSTTSSMQSMVESGAAFKNLTSLAVQERIMGRADGIAARLQTDYDMTSPEWKRWITLTDSYNATSLQQVMAAYYQDYTIADVGRTREDYIPRKGYPGTLAPGENFKDNYAIDDLPKRVLHPWPAMQEFRWHVRMPTTHPMIPPPLLWLGLNDMYTKNFTEAQLQEECDEVVGGTYMTPKDALRIARDHRLGAAYEASEQLPHGGSLFTGGHVIPFYNPDHGPTIPAEDSEPPIPAGLAPITTRWMDPHYGMDVEFTKSAAEEELASDMEDEEEQRRLAAISMGLIADEPVQVLSPLAAIEEAEKENAWSGAPSSSSKLEAELGVRVAERRRVLYGDPDTLESGKHARAFTPDVPGYEVDDPEVYREYGALPSVEHEVKQIIRTVGGRARSKVALIDYSIASVRDLRVEVNRVEKDVLSRTKGRGRAGRKKTAAVEVDSSSAYDAAEPSSD